MRMVGQMYTHTGQVWTDGQSSNTSMDNGLMDTSVDTENGTGQRGIVGQLDSSRDTHTGQVWTDGQSSITSTDGQMDTSTDTWSIVGQMDSSRNMHTGQVWTDGQTSMDNGQMDTSRGTHTGQVQTDGQTRDTYMDSGQIQSLSQVDGLIGQVQMDTSMDTVRQTR